MKAQRLILSGLVPVLAVSAFAVARSATQAAGVGGVNVPARSVNEPVGGVATLYAHDPLGWSMSLRDGGPGLVMQGNRLFNRDSTIAFDAYDADSFTVGVQGGDTGAIVDLGPVRDLGQRIGVKETVGGGQGWAAIAVKDGELGLCADGSNFTAWSVGAIDPAWSTPKPGSHVPVHDGHAYLVRSENGQAGPCVAKLIVIAHEPGVSVAMRWERLRP